MNDKRRTNYRKLIQESIEAIRKSEDMYDIAKAKKTVVLEDINILLNSGAINSYSIKFLKRKGIEVSDLAVDIMIFLYQDNSSKKYRNEWIDVEWNYYDEDKRRQHRAWIRNLSKKYINKTIENIRKEKMATEKMHEDIKTMYEELAKFKKDELLRLIEITISNELENDMVKWKMDMYIASDLTKKHGIGRMTLYRRWNSFKEKVVANAIKEGLL